MAATAVVVLVGAGVVSIVRTGLQLLRQEVPVSAAAPDDIRFAGVAELASVDYLTWDSGERDRRKIVLRRHARADVTVDGWDGTGSLVAQAATAVAVVRVDAMRSAVVTRVRVSPPTGGQSSWLTLTVPLTVAEDKVVVSAVPAVIADGPVPRRYPSADRLTGTLDEVFAKDSHETVARFLRSYAASELDYVRAPRVRIEGLGKSVELKRLVQWQVASAPADSGERVGSVTVLWALPSGAGSLRCSYRITLRRSDDRWLLAAIDPELDGGSV